RYCHICFPDRASPLHPGSSGANARHKIKTPPKRGVCNWAFNSSSYLSTTKLISILPQPPFATTLSVPYHRIAARITAFSSLVTSHRLLFRLSLDLHNADPSGPHSACSSQPVSRHRKQAKQQC